MKPVRSANKVSHDSFLERAEAETPMPSAQLGAVVSPTYVNVLIEVVSPPSRHGFNRNVQRLVTKIINALQSEFSCG